MVAVFWSKVKPILIKSYETGRTLTKFFKSLAELVEKVDKLQVKLDDVHKEVKPNHGSSMRDEIRQIRRSQITSDARDQAKFNLSDEPEWETNAEGRIVRVNRRYCDLVGRSSEDVMGNNWKLTIHPDDLSFVANEWQHIVEDGRDSLIKHRILKPDNTVISVIGKGEVMTGPQGEVLGWRGTLTPVPPQAVENIVETAKRTRVLLIEDATDTAYMFELGLSPYFDVKTAYSGRDGIQQFIDAQASGHPFDAILMDYAMPEMDGMEAIQQIRDREVVRNRTKILMFTGNDSKVSESNKREHHISDVIAKPTTPIEVAARLSRIIKHN